MRVLHTINLEVPGGKETHLYRFLQYEQSLTSHFVHEILHTGNDIHQRYRDYFRNTFAVYEYKRKLGLKIPRIVRPWFLDRRSLDCDINLFYEIQDSRLMELFVRRSRGTNVFHDRGHSWFLNAEEARWLARLEFFFANSHASKTMMSKKWGVPTERIEVLHNSFSSLYLDRLNRIGFEEKEAIRNTYHIGTDKLILYVGRFAALKGIHSIVEALDFLPDSGVKVLLVGDGRTRKALEDLVKRKHRDQQVIFAGMQLDTAPFYAAADVTVIPSAREPFGNVNLEAGLAESPIIASKVDGIPEIIPDDEHGCLLKPTVDPRRYAYLDLASIPELVVDPDTQNLIEPRFMDPEELAASLRAVLFTEPGNAREKALRLKARILREFSMQTRSENFRRLVSRLKRT